MPHLIKPEQGGRLPGAASRNLSLGLAYGFANLKGWNLKNLMLISLLAFAASTGVAEAKGCVKGAVVGGTAGHFVGHHPVAGAAVGCAVGRHEAKKKAAAPAQVPAQGAAKPAR